MIEFFFDTETTGLPQDYKAKASNTDNWPRIVQLAYKVFKEEKLIKSSNFIIRPRNFIIPKEASRVHGITTEKALDEGVELKDVLEEVLYWFNQKPTLIAHNYNFDSKVLGAEMIRLDMRPSLKYRLKYICTMLASIDYCKLPKPFGSGYKYPKLEELHRVLFNKGFEGAHDAMTDVNALVRCYKELERKNVIQRKDFTG